MIPFVKSLLVSSIILVHSWYPQSCCSDKDCRPVSCDELLDQRSGEIKYKNFTFRKDQVKPSEDGSCHVCIHEGKMPMCVFTLQSF